MNTHRKPLSLLGTAAIVFILLAVLTGSAYAAGSGGQILQANEEPRGYSLAEAAAATAYFNVGTRSLNTLPQNFPFQILYDSADTGRTFSVRTGTMFYVPVVYSDDTDGAYWPYPDVTDPVAVSAYYFDPAQLGAEFLRVIVDGRATDLGPAYSAGAVTPGLPTGGNNYTVVAAFLSPMSKGTHTVTVAGRLTGAFIGGVFEFEITYTVTVY